MSAKSVVPEFGVIIGLLIHSYSASSSVSFILALGISGWVIFKSVLVFFGILK